MIKEKFKSYAKVNLFLKIVGVQGNYHKLFSRFLRVDSLYDTLYLTKENRGEFYINGNFDFPLEKNIIYKTYISLLNYLDSYRRERVEKFFEEYSLKIEKKIPMMAGLGGGSSNSATFLNMINDILELNLEIEDRIEIVEKLGSDIIFFLYSVESANVYGTGDIIEPLNEKRLDIDVYTPPIECNTAKVYSIFRDKFFHLTPIESLESLKNRSSQEIFNSSLIESANDLYQPAKELCPKLKDYYKDGYLFSGSGSSFFRIRS